MQLLKEMMLLSSPMYSCEYLTEQLNECLNEATVLLELMAANPATYKPQTDDINKAIDWLLAARRGIGMLSKKDTIISPEDRAKHISRFFSNLNRIRALVDRLSKAHAQQYPDADQAMINMHSPKVQ